MVCCKLYAQDPQFSQFYTTPTYLNPAFAGASEQGRVILNYRNQWPSIPGSFVTYNFSYDQYIPEIKSGVGLTVTHDRAGRGALNTTNVALQYSYEFSINRKVSISPGIQYMSGRTNINLNDLTFYDQLFRGGADRASVEQQRNDGTKYTDFATGVAVYTDRFWFSAAAHHINTPNKSILGKESPLPMKINMNTGFQTTLRKKTLYKDEVLAMFALNFKRQQKFSQLDIGCYFNLNPMIVGVWYRGLPVGQSPLGYYSNRDAVVVMIGYHLEDFKIGYSHDFTVSKLTTNTGGAHEISIIYEFVTEGSRKKLRKYRKIPPCAKFL
jgi:type IX secretion system PorP/SprF family membrane protein